MSTARPFAELPLPPALASAIAARGYETATPVQAAVLDPALAGRDLIVSSQTGSGKTLAFGSLLLDSLLGEAGAAPRAPRALVVAPTRELATQVGRELMWLYADVTPRIRLSTFTGGTPYPPDLRALRAGVALAVGTPGRLVDHVKRGSLDLSALRAVVLDEADEMLDLGFKDDLEALLAAMPPERRTLMFSATLPPPIQRLATTYLRDPARIDAQGAGGAKRHADIEFVAHMVRPEDRLAAVVNVLLMAGDRKALVFCRTRDRVASLHEHLAQQGVSAEAIAGDRAQSQRDQALEALRSGRSRVLVATDVAARGLDLPELDLVIHGDLPDSGETLAHRSGRTGRAGRKGQAVVLAEPRERSKAERLLREVGARVNWTGAPSLEEVQEATERALLAELSAPEGDATDDGRGATVEALAERLRTSVPEPLLLARLLTRELARRPRGLPLPPWRPPVAPAPRVTPAARPTPAPRAAAAARPAPVARPHAAPAPRTKESPPRPNGVAASGGNGTIRRPPRADEDSRPVAKPRAAAPRPEASSGGAPSGAPIFRVSLGRDAGADAGLVLATVCRRGRISREAVGAIRLARTSATFEIAPAAAPAFADAALRPDPREPDVVFSRVAGARALPARSISR